MIRNLAFAGALALAPIAPLRANSLDLTSAGNVATASFEMVFAGRKKSAAARRGHDHDGARLRALVRASFYGGGRAERLAARTASGERFDPRALTAAHRSLPFGTRLRVSYRGRSIVVRINDRGPAASTGRALDLSRGAAAALGLTPAGVGLVLIERL